MKSTFENLMKFWEWFLRVLNISSYRLRGLKYRIVKGIVSRATLPPDGNYWTLTTPRIYIFFLYWFSVRDYLYSEKSLPWSSLFVWCLNSETVFVRHWPGPGWGHAGLSDLNGVGTVSSINAFLVHVCYVFISGTYTYFSVKFLSYSLH